MFNPDDREDKLSPISYLVEELELKDYPTVMIMEATLHIEIDGFNDWYIDHITIDAEKGWQRLPADHWLDAAIRRTVDTNKKVGQYIYDACVEESQ
jgi:hypothetical protein